ncbi:MAG: DSD1 family PLP-dependent enzyme [Desulfobacterales bacterium]|nr:MAG: DSD1 family PLP-dependent enzyme [Desulfobacterales bacterium]
MPDLIPARVGMRLEEVDTPALLIDLDLLEKNLERMVEDVKDRRVRLRPHAKTHKCAVIALKQIAQGAVGVCCQKVSEAEAMVYGGVRDVFISNEVVGRPKIERLGALARHAKVAVCADDPIHVAEYSRAAQFYDADLDVLIELNVGANRCGLPPGDALVKLADLIVASQRLRFAGLHAYHGAAQHLRTWTARQKAIAAAVGRTMEAVELLQQQGIACETITGAGTGTYPLEADSGIFNEIQPGSYVFMDADYAKNLDENGRPLQAFKQSLFVYTTVMSRPTADRAVVDAGLKAVAVDSGMPLIPALDDVDYRVGGDEHGQLILHDPGRDLKIGDKLRMVPGHCDPTVNLYDWYVGIRKNHVESIWPIAARGAIL